MKKSLLIALAMALVLTLAIGATAIAETAHTHTWVKDTENAGNKAATCTEDGLQYWKCTCGSTMSTTLKATGHKSDLGTVTVPANCGVPGEKVYYCLNANCPLAGAPLKTEVIPATGKHTWKLDETSVAATCGLDGHNDYTCSVCGDTKTEVLKATGKHTWEADGTVLPTCTEKGYTYYTCSVCDQEKKDNYVNALGHNWSKIWTVDLEPTCQATGLKSTYCLNDPEHKKTEVLAKVAHVFDTTAAPTVVVGPTHTKTGIGTIPCKWAADGCKVVKEVTIKALGHDAEANWEKTVTPATCEKDGKEVYTCSCGDIMKTVVLKKLGHKYELAETIVATCEKDGKLTYVCANDETHTYSVVLPKTGHNTHDVVTLDPTCTTVGTKNVVCSNENCDKPDRIVKADVEVPALGHNAKWIVTLEPTAKQPGIKKLVCQRCGCGKVLDEKEIPYTIMHYNSTMTSDGPSLRDIDTTSKLWNRVTPIDLTKEGTFTYNLIASNKFVVGTMTVVIANGEITVSIAPINAVEIKDEFFAIYKDLATISAGIPSELSGMELGKAYSIADTFGDATSAIIVLNCKVNYDALANGVVDYSVDAAAVEAMTALIK